MFSHALMHFLQCIEKNLKMFCNIYFVNIYSIHFLPYTYIEGRNSNFEIRDYIEKLGNVFDKLFIR